MNFQDIKKKKNHENPSGGSRVVPCGRTDRHDETKSPFRHSENAPKTDTPTHTHTTHTRTSHTHTHNPHTHIPHTTHTKTHTHTHKDTHPHTTHTPQPHTNTHTPHTHTPHSHPTHTSTTHTHTPHTPHTHTTHPPHTQTHTPPHTHTLYESNANSQYRNVIALAVRNTKLRSGQQERKISLLGNMTEKPYHTVIPHKQIPSSLSSSSSYICHAVGSLVDPFRSHVSRSLFKVLP